VTVHTPAVTYLFKLDAQAGEIQGTGRPLDHAEAARCNSLDALVHELRDSVAPVRVEEGELRYLVRDAELRLGRQRSTIKERKRAAGRRDTIE
jgi:hypothetical protein